MFWKFNNTSSSQIETVLANQDVTLQEVMDKEDILNECKMQNKALIEFLIKPEILHELVAMTITEPPEEGDERSRFKYAYIACEMITCDIPSINERLASDEVLLSKLYAFLDKEPPLNPLLASFFSKIVAVLIANQNEQNWISNQFTCLQVLDFLKAKDNFVTLLLNHLSTSAIMDLTLKLMTQVKGAEVKQNILNYLDSQRIIQNLVALLDPKVESDRHHNVAQLLCDFIRESRDPDTERNDPDLLLSSLESPETVSLLLDHILSEEKSETAIVAGIEVLLELLRSSIISCDERTLAFCNVNHEEMPEMAKHSVVMESTTKEIQKRLKDIHQLLIDPPKKQSIVTTVGTLDPPLGNTRLHVTKLLAAVIKYGGPEMVQELIALDTLNVLLDLFFAFPWNNFLHTQVQACIFAALSKTLPSEQGDSIALSKYLLVNCKLVERILNAWKENEEKTNGSSISPISGVRQGYMGHLINIANYIVTVCKDSPLGIMLNDNCPEVSDELKTFSETSLAERNLIHETLLGGMSPHNINDDSDDYNIPFAASGTGQQIYNEFQNQQLALNSFEPYGYNDDEFEFKDSDDALQSGMNFDLSEGDLEQQHESFKQICAHSINFFYDPSEQMQHEDTNSCRTVIQKEDGEHNNSSSGSDEDGDDIAAEGGDFCNDLNASNEDSAVPVTMSENPWDSKEANEKEESESGWADFSMWPSPEAKTTNSMRKKDGNSSDDELFGMDNELHELCEQLFRADNLKMEVVFEDKHSDVTTPQQSVIGEKVVVIEPLVEAKVEEIVKDAVVVGGQQAECRKVEDGYHSDDNSAPQIGELKQQIELVGQQQQQQELQPPAEVETVGKKDEEKIKKVEQEPAAAAVVDSNQGSTEQV